MSPLASIARSQVFPVLLFGLPLVLRGACFFKYLLKNAAEAGSRSPMWGGRDDDPSLIDVAQGRGIVGLHFLLEILQPLRGSALVLRSLKDQDRRKIRLGLKRQQPEMETTALILVSRAALKNAR